MSLNLLVIDDSKAVRSLVANALKPFACTVNEATNGFTGLFAMERSLPDLLILDVNMPTMDGVEMLGMLKSNDQLKAIPVIMLTAPTDHKVLPRIKELGVDGLLKKPLSEAAVVEAVRAVVALESAKA